MLTWTLHEDKKGSQQARLVGLAYRLYPYRSCRLPTPRVAICKGHLIRPRLQAVRIWDSVRVRVARVCFIPSLVLFTALCPIRCRIKERPGRTVVHAVTNNDPAPAR